MSNQDKYKYTYVQESFNPIRFDCLNGVSTIYLLTQHHFDISEPQNLTLFITLMFYDMPPGLIKNNIPKIPGSFYLLVFFNSNNKTRKVRIHLCLQTQFIRTTAVQNFAFKHELKVRKLALLPGSSTQINWNLNVCTCNLEKLQVRQQSIS